ncbi:hypothetical protein BH10CHL1_BH10CHL1_27080 [soil metagenome]
MRIGLIGCGGIGELRAKAAAATPAVELVAVSDLDEKRARFVASQYGGVVTSDWRALLQREDVEAVIVSTPPSLHAEMCMAALRAGKHVLCEKPLARTPEECRAILAVAEQEKRFIATGFNYRFYPSIAKAHALLQSGIIGELDHIRSYTGYSAAEHNHAWLHDEKVMGGGALRDNGIHLIDLTAYFLGDVAEVKGFASSGVWGFAGCEDNGFALLRSSKGKVATLQASWTEWRGYQLKIELYGTLGCIRTWCFPMATQVVWSKTRGGRMQTKWHWFPKTQLMEKLYSYRWVVTASFIEELTAFAGALQGKITPLATGQAGLRAVEIAQWATRNAGDESSGSLPVAWENSASSVRVG